MRPTPWIRAEPFRDRLIASGRHHYGDPFGPFTFYSQIDGAPLRTIVSSGEGWEHVSVSRTNRCPNWPEMCFIKDVFWGEEECVMQLHPPRSAYVNNHPHCLHLWKPVGLQIPTPPIWMV